MNNTSFYIRHIFLLFACSFQILATCSSLMSYYWVNNKCNRVKGRRWRWLIYALHNFLLRNNILRVFRSNHHCSGKFHKFHRKTPVLESLCSKSKVILYHCKPISSFVHLTSTKTASSDSKSKDLHDDPTYIVRTPNKIYDSTIEWKSFH